MPVSNTNTIPQSIKFIEGRKPKSTATSKTIPEVSKFLTRARDKPQHAQGPAPEGDVQPAGEEVDAVGEEALDERRDEGLEDGCDGERVGVGWLGELGEAGVEDGEGVDDVARGDGVAEANN